MHALGVQEFTVLPQTFATFSCAMSQCKEHGHCHVSPRLIELSAIVPNCFMLSRETIFTEVLPIQPEDLPIPLITSVQGSCSFSVMGQEARQLPASEHKDTLNMKATHF